MAAPSWQQRMAAWSDSWKSAWASAQARWAQLVEQSPREAAAKAEPTVRAFAAWRAELDAIKARYEQLTHEERVAWQKQANAYHTAGAGLYADSHEVQVGLAPIVILGVAFTVAAVAWAISIREFAVAHRDETALLRRELEERIARTPAGEPLPPSTLPDRAPMVDVDAGGGGAVVAVLGLVGVLGLGFAWARSRG